MTNNDGRDKEKEEKEERKQPYAHYEDVIVQHVHSFYLCDEIEEPIKYTDLIHRITTASENDLVYLNLNTPGGNLYTGVQIINAMRAARAHVITVLVSRAFSLGTFLFLAGDEWHVHDNAMMMFHNFAGTVSGKGNEQLEQISSTVRWFNKLIKKYCSPFLTEAEIDRVIRGEDIWMDSDEIRKRLKRHSRGKQ